MGASLRVSVIPKVDHLMPAVRQDVSLLSVGTVRKPQSVFDQKTTLIRKRSAGIEGFYFALSWFDLDRLYFSRKRLVLQAAELGAFHRFVGGFFKRVRIANIAVICLREISYKEDYDGFAHRLDLSDHFGFDRFCRRF